MFFFSERSKAQIQITTAHGICSHFNENETKNIHEFCVYCEFMLIAQRLCGNEIIRKSEMIYFSKITEISDSAISR